MDPLTMDWRHRRPVAELPLFAAPSVPVDTSESAADAITPHVRWQHRLVCEALARTTAGLTRQEIETETRLDGNTIRPRVWELVTMGYVVATGKRARTTSGRQAKVLALTDLGRRTLARPDGPLAEGR